MRAGPRTIPAAVLCCLLSGIQVLAQQYVFLHYSPEDGLAQSQVRCMAQDPTGHLWFGTLGGVSRFDGLVFENHALQEGLPDPQVNALYCAPGGTVWMGAGHHLTRWDGGTLKVVPWPDTISAARILDLCGDGADGVLIATDGQGVLHWTGKGVRPLRGYPADTAARVRALHPMPDGSVLIGLRDGLLRWKGGRTSSLPIGDDRAKSIAALAHSADGTIWVATFGDGLYRVAPDGSQRNYTDRDGLLQNNLRHVLVDRHDRVWASSKFGVNLIPVAENERIRSFTIHQGMASDNVWCGFEDSDGNLWFGTDGAGALRYTGERFITFTAQDGLCSDQVMSFTPDAHGDIWMGTYGSGICRMDGMAFITTFDGLPNNTVWCGITDDLGRLWFGTSEGTCRLEDGRVVIPEGDAALSGSRILSLFQGRDGTIWCGSREGLHALRKNGAVDHYTDARNGPGRSVRSILQDARGRLWMGSDAGVASFDGTSFGHHTVRNGLADNTVFCLLLDRKERLWAGTANGLSCMVDGAWRTVRFANDFGSNYIDLLITGPDGMVWAGTNNGLYRFAPDALLSDQNNVEHFTVSDGLRNLECNLNSALVDARGRLLIGTSGGVVLHDPEKVLDRGPARPPRLMIRDIRSFLQTTDWRANCDSISAGTGLPLGLRLPYRRNHLTFDHVAISMTDPKRVRYRYMLEGVDEDWLPETDDRFATYSNLPNGRYTYHVRAKGRGGAWSDPVSFSFTVLPPWWLSWWFFGLCAVIVAATAYGIHHVRGVVRQRHERTRQLMLRSRMLQLEQQALNANMNRHFIFNALNSIQYYINRQDRTAANRYLTSFAKLIRKNLDASQNDTTSLAEELERLELYLTLEHMRFKDKFRYELLVDAGVDTRRVSLPAMMLQPYVENSIWHGILPTGKQGTVRISVSPDGDDHVLVRIEDDGIGVEQSLLQKAAASSDHISRGIEITKGRTDVLRNLHLTDIRISGPTQLHANGMVIGTQVLIALPYASEKMIGPRT